MESPASGLKMPTVMRGSFRVAVVLASLVPAGCFLQQGTDGYAASGTAGSNGNDGGAPGGSGGATAGRGGGGSGTGGTVMNCSSLAPFGCVCSPLEPSQVGACNTS